MAGSRIRALYGHSLPGRLVKTPDVHLSVDVETAGLVGMRKSPGPVILAVAASAASAAGTRFYQGNEVIWLADMVPARFISRL